MHVCRNWVLVIAGVALSGCTGSSGPDNASPTSALAQPWMGDTSKTIDVTPADRAARLAALKTDQSRYLGILQTSDWIARNCQIGTISAVHTDLGRQEMEAARSDEASRAQLDTIEETLAARVTTLGGTSQACNVHFARGVSPQLQLFITVSGLPT